MGSADGTSIQTDRLTCTWKVEMKRKDNIKGEGVSEKGGGSEKSGKKHCSSIKSNL